MKTLLCPIDFSILSRATTQYAARLAQEMDAKIILVAANPVIEKIPAGKWNRREEAFHVLDEWRDQIANQFHVPCETRKDIITSSKQLSILADEFDLLMLGLTKIKRGTIMDYAGFELLKIIRDTLAPILIIPDNYKFSKVKRLLYAYDYHSDASPALQQIKWLADWFNAEVTFISILPGELPLREEDRLNLTQDKISARWSTEKNLRFETIVYHNVSRCLEHYLSLWEKNDLLVLSVNHTSMLEKLWHKSVVRQLLKYGAHPYVILHR